MSRKKDDWKNWKKGWKYKRDAPYDPEWKKDRLKCFRKHGNGWWINAGYIQGVIKEKR